VSGGYTDQKLDADHFQVTFKGNSDTPRATVESYLLYRAAEITVAQGYDWFETVQRHTDRQKETYVDPDLLWTGYAGAISGPIGTSMGRGTVAGWAAIGRRHPDVQKFEATAEIALHHGPSPRATPGGWTPAKSSRTSAPRSSGRRPSYSQAR